MMNLIDLVRKSRLEIENSKEVHIESQSIWANYVVEKKIISKYLIKHVDAAFIKKIAENNEFLKQFEKEDLESVFFHIEGDLGWNIYLVFVLDDDEYENLILKDKFLIESNENYARKIVIKQNDFLKYIPVGQIINNNEGKLITDPISEWSTQLGKDDLNFTLRTYSKKNIENYIKGNLEVHQTKEDMASDNSEENDKSLNIEYLQLGNGFRDYCFNANTQLNFGKINLFSGANGCGKTSVLEAIELTMTGEIKKSNSKNISEIYQKDLNSNCMLKFDNGEVIGVPRKPRETKSRETIYYQNKEKMFSKLNRAFHQYNYYSYEDTFSFCFLDDQPNYSDEFSKIIFGESAKTIEKNWLKYKLEFDNKLKDIYKENISLINQKDVINDITTVIDVDFTLVPLIKFMDRANINYLEIPKSSEPEKIKEWLGKEKAVLKPFKMEISNILKRADINTKEEIQKIYANKIIDSEGISSKLKSVSEGIETIYNNINKIGGDLEKLKSEKSQITKSSRDQQMQMEKYNSYSFIFDNISNSNNVLNLKSQENNKFIYVKKLEYIKNEWGNLLEIEICGLNIKAIEGSAEGLRNENSELKLKLQMITDEILIEGEKKSAIEKVISQIKVLGKQYIVESPQSKTCPLCGEMHNSHEEFLNSINNSMLIDDSVYKELLQNKNHVLKDIDEIDKNIEGLILKENYLISLYKANNYIGSNKILDGEFDLESISQEEMRNNLLTCLDLFLPQESELNNISSKLASLRVEGLAYENVIEALRFINVKDNTSYGLLNDESVEKVKKSHESELGIANKEIEKFSEQINSAIEALNVKKVKLTESIKIKENLESILLKLNKEKIDINYIIKDVTLLEESGVLKEYNISYKKLIGYIDDIILEIENINEIIEKKISQKVKAEQILILDKKLKVNVDEKQKCEKAINDLGELKLLEKYCEDFIESNIKGISDLFTSLHMPREFQRLGVDDNGRIVGYRDNELNEQPVPVFMMSTGQRSSVVLSIFIKLHMNMKSSPNFIMLDEPVANIDDLNILALLDFLREVSISNNTQIFLTTANEGVAKLFKRKFSYNEEKFCDFKFTRYGNEKTIISKNTYNNKNDILTSNIII